MYVERLKEIRMTNQKGRCTPEHEVQEVARDLEGVLTKIKTKVSSCLIAYIMTLLGAQDFSKLLSPNCVANTFNSFVIPHGSHQSGILK